MIRIIIVIICVLFSWKSTIAQCNNEVSTDPFGASNLALPDVLEDGHPNNPDVRYLNGFDWINGNADPNNQEYKLTNMYYNPGQPYWNMANIQDANLTGYYRYLNKHNGGGEEMNIQNGWELMLINLGKYPDDQNEHTNTTLNDVPYLVFYNKYKGILRVFVQRGYNAPTPLTNDGVTINLLYDDPNNMSGILRLGEGIDRSLDTSSFVHRLSTVALKQGQTSFWISGDFQLTYDPCVCFKPSNLSLDFVFFKEEDFKLYGRGISVEESLIANGNVLDKSFLSNIDYTEGTSENGLIIYNKMEDLIEDYIDQMEKYQEKLTDVQEHNAEVEKNLKIAKAVSYIIKFGISTAIGSTPVLALQGDLTKFFFNDTTPESKKIVEKLFSEFEKLLGKQLDTYINKSFKTKSEPTPPTAPSVVFSEMHFDGNLTTIDYVSGPTFSTPGSFGNNKYTVDLPYGGNVYGYPVYNNPVGVFALLEKPKIRLSETIINKVEIQDQLNLPPDTSFLDASTFNSVKYFSHNIVNQEWTNEYQFELAEDLKYTLNQSLDIKEYSISASFIVEPKYIFRNSPLSGIFSSYLNHDYSVNTSTYLDDHTKLLYSYEYDTLQAFLNSEIYHLPQFQLPPNFSDTSERRIRENVDLIKYETPFIPIDNFKPLVYSIGLKNNKLSSYKWLKKVEYFLFGTKIGQDSYTVDPIPFVDLNLVKNDKGMYYEMSNSFKLKLKINVVYNTINDQGLNNEGTYIFTYDIDSINVEKVPSQLENNLFSSNLNIGEFQEDLLLGTTHFAGQQVEGCLLVGSNYTCKAWNNATIEGNLTVANGYTVTISGTNEVNVLPESSISSEIVLQINSAFPIFEPMPEIDPSEVASFCNGTNPNLPPYMANVGNKSKFLDTNQVITETTIPEPKQPFSFSLFPNPTTQQTTVKVNGEYADQVSIVVYDIAGKEQRVAISGEGGRFNLDVAHLAKGLYLVKVSTFGESQTKQLVIN